MEKRHKILIFQLLIMGIFLVFSSSCEKDDAIGLNGKTTALFNPDEKYGSMTDQDGNVYKTVTIGTQTWMAENLRTTKYNDGKVIPNVADNAEWETSSTGVYCNYNNTTNTDTIATYGCLYNRDAVNSEKLAPEGWHIPIDTEWQALCLNFGIETGGKLKEVGTTHWADPNKGATNESGFTALPSGYRHYRGKFYDIGNRGCWWSASMSDVGLSYYWFVDFEHSYVGNGEYPMMAGLSVRCVKD